MWSKARLVLFILFIVQYTGISQKSTLEYSPDSFANFLFNSELYEFAGEEYERLFFHNPDSLQYFRRLIECSKLSGKREVISNRLSLHSVQNPRLLNSYYDILIITNNANLASESFLSKKDLFNSDEQNDIRFKLAVSRKDWDEASYIYKSNLVSENYGPIIKQVESSNFKSPGLAAFMSGIIPGSGRFYAKDPKDALISLLFIATSGYQAYRRFDQKGIKSVGGWIFAGISFGFYVGNIYGSHKSARFYNKKINDQIYNNALPIIADVPY